MSPRYTDIVIVVYGARPVRP